MQPPAGVEALLDGVPVCHVQAQVLTQSVQTVELSDRHLSSTSVSNSIHSATLHMNQHFQLFNKYLLTISNIGYINVKFMPSWSILPWTMAKESSLHISISLASMATRLNNAEDFAQKLGSIFSISRVKSCLKARGDGCLIPVRIKAKCL
ncbi:hypothetical protein EGW08_019146 [Elysia chlorotica]|uniref:Uncharacterized protein n=1 Tax=Elysia chlorotica TaxID=188477 RepID=A0A3S0ZQQ2_ELYCH|nr:hypothetical protein EGW08_019146 [Elysia chlorotica]